MAMRGDMAVVFGPSGCGKTTLLRIAAGLLRPDAGRVLVMGIDIYGLRRDELDRFALATMGYMPQEDRLIETLTIGENVALPLIAQRVRASEISGRVRAKLGLLGIEKLYDRYPSEASMGERKRALLARALVNDPAILLLDEPTANLDSENVELLLGYLKMLNDEEGITILASTHDERMASPATSLFKLLDGRLTLLKAQKG